MIGVSSARFQQRRFISSLSNASARVEDGDLCTGDTVLRRNAFLAYLFYTNKDDGLMSDAADHARLKQDRCLLFLFNYFHQIFLLLVLDWGPSMSSRQEKANPIRQSMSIRQERANPIHCPDLVRRLEELLCHPGNELCADCGSPDPKWVSLNVGVFICIKCSGVHRSLGVHISKVLSVKLDEWTAEQVEALGEMGGNTILNAKYEAFLSGCSKPRPDSPFEERSDFIRRKYELLQFSHCIERNASSLNTCLSSAASSSGSEKKSYEKQHTSNRLQVLGHAFRNSWRRKDEQKSTSKKGSTIGMVEFVGLIKVNVVRGTNLAVRDVVTSDPYVILTLGHQSMKTRVIKNNLNPVWNERIMLSIPDPVPPLKLQVYDKDTFSTDDRMGEAEIDIQPLVSAAKAYENSTISEPMHLGKWLANEDNTLIKDSQISVVEGKVRQEITLRLQNVERGELEIELECVPLIQ
ncbi:hypothetical protein H6P81_015023 [Aristolochia fimbriata]|uniref:ADP-ribosylation factor GTPase-activating protein AGD11 n=1 Tax=Aristolochia fimbriata TaxID=158543 RepID=A0AAV7E504_ARIFI|nr:hypothetical protein H6P81_015023 [Aristolochia fimbriata]